MVYDYFEGELFRQNPYLNEAAVGLGYRKAFPP
jgi:hypothetical protein